MSDVNMDKRPYHSPLRREQALATRQRILDAALALFAAHGYGATSIVSIAREAGVVPETIYAAFGTKRGIIDGLVERAAPQTMVGDIVAGVRAKADDPAAQLALLVAFTASFWERNDALAHVFRQGTGDAEIGDEWSMRQGYRRALVSEFVADWPDTALRTGLDRERAVDVIWGLSSDEVFHLFVRERGWSTAAFEAWLVDVLRREVLAKPD
jgi:AcrR family transcriptional regulator